MTKQSKLREILSHARWGDYEHDDGRPAYGLANKPELEQAILDFINEVIGEDERDTSAEDLRAGTFQRGQDKAISGRNQLRAEQRKTAGIENKGDY